ncbi:TetR/AcrR family transcriptional regulator [Acrocarpospora catenulata]|uniref:TetR/AcrR family transcriptional regulator n=1 Tax=Acrocarpospora catenulata TaxID=2836182 RepID=UPI001BD99873|nr:TetR/AcrR family transcriptional regulator [Acrocarpospora catenulata]
MRRDELLDAAEALLADQGERALTLAAVADRAGVSKGGLLYHFGTKDALVNGMIERLIADFDALIAAQQDSCYTRAYIKATFVAVRTGRLRRWAVVTGAAGDPALLTPLRDAMARWHTHGLAEEPDPVMSRIVRLACEGLWETATQCPAVFDPRDDQGNYEDLRERLLALVP